jgi:head-tail adaptor
MPSKSESTQQGLRMAAQPSRVRIRYMDGITSDMRVVVHDATAIMVYDWDAYFNRPALSGYADSVMEITAGPTEIFGRRKWLEFMVMEYTS